MRPLWTKLRDRLAEDGSVALVTVIGTEGSTPREVGARMIVTREGHIAGTVGGGTLEHRIISEAQAAIRNEGWRSIAYDVPLGPDLGQCCGGRLSYLIETFGVSDLQHINQLAAFELQGSFATEGHIGTSSHLQRYVIDYQGLNDPVMMIDKRVCEVFADKRSPVLLFGAGHIGRALTIALAPLPFHIRWIDSRDDAFPNLLPMNVSAVRGADIDAEIRSAPANAFVLVMTHSHPLDLAIVSSALRREDLPFIGLIGSDTKRARFMRRLDEMGLGSVARARLVSPVGLHGISGKEPAVIAASIAADLLLRREALMRQRDQEKNMASLERRAIGDYPNE